MDLAKSDLLFYRRKWQFSAPSQLAKEDHKFVVKQCEKSCDWMLEELEYRNPNWVHKPSVCRRANNKLSQLRAAENAGLILPPTLVSNCYKDVLNFCEKHQDCIVKPIFAKSWEEEGTSLFTFTAKVPIGSLQKDEVEYAPMIYQTAIRKLAEYRVLVFGDSITAVRIDPNIYKETAIDWRRAADAPLNPKIEELPTDINRAILKFCSLMGIVMGAFDFILDTEGNFVFLEVNESGQFLWLENQLPEARLLEKQLRLVLALLELQADTQVLKSINLHNFFRDFPPEQFHANGPNEHKKSNFVKI